MILIDAHADGHHTTAITLLPFKTFARSKTAHTMLKKIPLLFDFPGIKLILRKVLEAQNN